MDYQENMTMKVEEVRGLISDLNQAIMEKHEAVGSVTKQVLHELKWFKNGEILNLGDHIKKMVNDLLETGDPYLENWAKFVLKNTQKDNPSSEVINYFDSSIQQKLNQKEEKRIQGLNNQQWKKVISLIKTEDEEIQEEKKEEEEFVYEGERDISITF